MFADPPSCNNKCKAKDWNTPFTAHNAVQSNSAFVKAACLSLNKEMKLAINTNSECFHTALCLNNCKKCIP